MPYWTISNPEQVQHVFFKPCKKTADHYKEEIQGLLYKKPYKYFIKLFVGRDAHPAIHTADVSVQIIYANGEEIQDDQAIKNCTYYWTEEDGCFEIGPFFYTICSYKHRKRMFRLRISLSIEGQVICNIESRKFLIKAKKAKKKSNLVSLKNPVLAQAQLEAQHNNSLRHERERERELQERTLREEQDQQAYLPPETSEEASPSYPRPRRRATVKDPPVYTDPNYEEIEEEIARRERNGQEEEQAKEAPRPAQPQDQSKPIENGETPEIAQPMVDEENGESAGILPSTPTSANGSPQVGSGLLKRNDKPNKTLEHKKLLPARLRRNWQIS